MNAPKYSADVRWSEEDRAEGWPLPEPAVHQGFSGQFRVRMPRSLHAWLVREAHREGVSLNTLVIARLAEARGQGSTRDRRELASEEARPVEIAP